jgi:hypothetical protein
MYIYNTRNDSAFEDKTKNIPKCKKIKISKNVKKMVDREKF